MNLLRELKFGAWFGASVWAGWWVSRLFHPPPFYLASIPVHTIYQVAVWFCVAGLLFYAGLIIHTANAPLEEL